MLLYLVRHPQPQIAAGICYGQADIAVSAADNLAAAQALQGCWPAGTPVFSSPLQRCLALARHLHEAPQQDARLMEMAFGDWERRSWEQIARSEVDAWAADTVHYRPGGGENVLDMAQRILAFIDDLRQSGVAAAVIVSHAGSMRLLQAWQPGMSALELAQQVCRQPANFHFGQCVQLQLQLLI